MARSILKALNNLTQDERVVDREGRTLLQPIFVIEDDTKIARVVKVYLEGAGYRVVHFEKGKDGRGFCT